MTIFLKLLRTNNRNVSANKRQFRVMTEVVTDQILRINNSNIKE